MQVSGKGRERERSGVICGAPFLCLPLTAPTGTGSDEFVGWESWKAPGSLPSLNLGMVYRLPPELGGLPEPPGCLCEQGMLFLGGFSFLLPSACHL